MFPRAALVLLSLLVAAIVAIFVLAELVAPHSTWHFEPMVATEYRQQMRQRYESWREVTGTQATA